MTALLGTNVASAIVPFDSLDTFSTHKALYGLGGYRSVADTAARDAIPQARREAGMEVCCIDTYNVYRLNADLTTWKKIADGYVAASGGEVLAGIGVPSILEPAGTIYARTDAAGLYTSHPTTSGTPAVVQSAIDIHSSTIPGSVTLPGAPTTGNLIIAHISFSNGTSAPPTVNTASWTLLDQDLNGSNAASFRLYRYAQVGDTAALPAFCTAGAAYWAAVVWEISGVTGTPATDFESHYATHEAGSASFTVDQLANANIGDLALVCFGQYDGAANITLAGSQWTTDQTGNNAAQFGAMLGAHASVISVGTISAAATLPTSSQFATASMIIIKTGGTASANWTLESSATGANPTATASDTAVNGSAATFMRSDAAPAIQKASASQFGLVKVDGSSITASAGVISAAGNTPANPSATASDTAVNGSASTFMRSDAAPAVQKGSSSQFGIVKVDGTTITASGGVITAVGGGGGGGSNVVMVMIAEWIPGSAATSHTFSGLAGDTDIQYIVEGCVVNGASASGGSVPAAHIQPNGDSTSGHYTEVGIFNGGSETSEVSPFGFCICRTGNATSSGGFWMFHSIINAAKAYPRTALTHCKSASSVLEETIIANTWTDTTNQITSLVVTSNITNMFGVGTRIALWARRTI